MALAKEKRRQAVLDRDADLEAPHGNLTAEVFQPPERLERCRQTHGLTLSACELV